MSLKNSPVVLGHPVYAMSPCVREFIDISHLMEKIQLLKQYGFSWEERDKNLYTLSKWINSSLDFVIFRCFCFFFPLFVNFMYTFCKPHLNIFILLFYHFFFKCMFSFLKWKLLIQSFLSRRTKQYKNINYIKLILTRCRDYRLRDYFLLCN